MVKPIRLRNAEILAQARATLIRAGRGPELEQAHKREAGANWPDDRHGYTREAAVDPSAAEVPGLRSNPPMAAARGLGC